MVDSATVNGRANIFLKYCFYFFWFVPRSGIARLYGSFNFGGQPPYRFLWWPYQFTSPPTVHKGPLLHCHWHLLSLFFVSFQFFSLLPSSLLRPLPSTSSNRLGNVSVSSSVTWIPTNTLSQSAQRLNLIPSSPIHETHLS